MPGSTPTYGFPFPLGSEPVGNGDQAMEDLAVAIEDLIAEFDGVWQDHAGGFSGVTLGNGSKKIRYRIDARNRTCEIQGALKLGSTSAVTGSIGVGLPVNMKADLILSAGLGMQVPIGVAWAQDDSASGRHMGAVLASASTLGFRRTATAEGGWGFGGGVPFTWDTDDWLTFAASYEIA
jgi:hypothetical protein